MAKQSTKSIVVQGDVSEIYRLWENFENFPNFMKNIKSITTTGGRTSHWVVSGPMGKDIEFDARITEQEPNKRIAWKSTGGDVGNQGQVTFDDLGNNRTKITVMMQYDIPSGKAGEAVAKVFSDPDRMLDEDLKNFKEYAEQQLEPSLSGR